MPVRSEELEGFGIFNHIPYTFLRQLTWLGRGKGGGHILAILILVRRWVVQRKMCLTYGFPISKCGFFMSKLFSIVFLCAKILAAVEK